MAAASFQPLVASKRADGVFEQIRSRILSGVLAAGDQLPNERDLAQQLEVNRSSVREAMKRLEFLELVEVRHGQGTFVRNVGGSSSLQLVETLLRDPRTVTVELLTQILEFRRHVTLQVVELAARHRTPAQLERARALLTRERSESGDPQSALEVDVELNQILGEATGNLMYQLLSNLFTKLVRRLGPLYYNESRDTARSLETHRELFAAIEARDPSAAARIVGRMLDYSEGAILALAEGLEVAGRIGPGARGDFEGLA